MYTPERESIDEVTGLDKRTLCRIGLGRAAAEATPVILEAVLETASVVVPIIRDSIGHILGLRRIIQDVSRPADNVGPEDPSDIIDSMASY